MSKVVHIRRRGLRGVLLAATLLTSSLSTTAVAAGGTINLSIQPIGQSYLITASGAYTEFPSVLDVYVHNGTAGCPATDQAEKSRVEQQARTLGTNAAGVLMDYELGTNTVTSGSYSEQAYWGLGAPAGTYWVCAYLLVPQPPNNAPVDPPQATASARLTSACATNGSLSSQAIASSRPHGAGLPMQICRFAITSLALYNFDGAALQFLSTSMVPNTYYGGAADRRYAGNTVIWGTITVQGPQGDAVRSLSLEVLERDQVVATAELAPPARSALLNHPFGAGGTLQIRNKQLLFLLSSAQGGQVDQTTDITLTLRARAQSTRGEMVTRQVGGVRKLVRYTGDNRFGQRDEGLGGDDWVKPSVKTVIEHFGDDILWNDFSKMNGGHFAPHHLHQTGNDVDGIFADHSYDPHSAATARTLIDDLNDRTYGYRITAIYVAYCPDRRDRVCSQRQYREGDAFWQTIRTVTLDDGRRASAAIRADPGHKDHFHWTISDVISV